MTAPGEFVASTELRGQIGRRVSVVAVNFDGGAVLQRFIESVWASDTPPLELLVVDNGSTDGSVDWLAARGDLELLVSQENRGFGGGCSTGAARARGDLLLFANPDVAFAPAMLGALAGNLIANPEVAVSFPKMIAPGGAHVAEPKLEDVATMAGAVMLVERAHFERLGGFDPRMFLYYEETDFCWRSRLVGRRVTQDWQAVALHEAHGAGGGARWAGEQIRNGLLAHLKLRAWPAVGRYAARMLIKTVVRGSRTRDADVLAAWYDNARRLRTVLAERRRLRGAATPEARAELELLCAQNEYWQAHHRREALKRALRARFGR